MGIVVRIPRFNCNLNCEYCYLNFSRASTVEGEIAEYIKKTRTRLEGQEGEVEFTGGEPLTIGKENLEELLAVVADAGGRVRLNTNGTLLDHDFLKMFERYNTRVGVSVDGPGGLNDCRWAGSLKETRKKTKKTIESIKMLAESSCKVDVICVLSKKNVGNKERLEKFKSFLTRIKNLKIDDIDLIFLRPMGSEQVFRDAMITSERLGEIYIELARFFENYPNFNCSPFTYYKKLIKGKSSEVPCYWRACDSRANRFVGQYVEGNKIVDRSCLMANNAGVEFLASEVTEFNRYWLLYNTPQELGGCEGCRFFSICLGHCPASGLNGDYRNRSKYCRSQKIIFSYYEEKLTENGNIPVTRHPARPEVEKKMVANFKNNVHKTQQQALEEICPSYYEQFD